MEIFLFKIIILYSGNDKINFSGIKWPNETIIPNEYCLQISGVTGHSYNGKSGFVDV